MHYRVFLFLLTIIPFASAPGQSTSLVNFINCIESQNGPDNLLVNGRPYLPENPRAEGHAYFQTEEWQPGMVYINGNSYPANNLKYNLFNYQLIIKYVRPNGTNQKVVLSELLIDSFLIEERLFVNRELILSDKENGYLEKIFEEELSFYRLQKKVFNSPTNSMPNGQFSNLKDVFYLLGEDKEYKITQKNEFLDCFPEHKSQIKKYMKNNSLKWKKMSANQFANLLKFCNDQI